MPSSFQTRLSYRIAPSPLLGLQRKCRRILCLGPRSMESAPQHTDRPSQISVDVDEMSFSEFKRSTVVIELNMGRVHYDTILQSIVSGENLGRRVREFPDDC